MVAQNSQSARGVGDALRVIAAGVRDHAALALRLGQRRDLVIRTADLERTDGLPATRASARNCRRCRSG